MMPTKIEWCDETINFWIGWTMHQLNKHLIAVALGILFLVSLRVFVAIPAGVEDVCFTYRSDPPQCVRCGDEISINLTGGYTHCSICGWGELCSECFHDHMTEELIL